MTVAPKRVDWKKTERIVGEYTSRWYEEFKRKAADISGTAGIGEKLCANAGLSEVGEQVLLLRDVLWLSYDKNLKVIVNEYAANRRAIGAPATEELSDLKIDDETSTKHLDRLIFAAIERRTDTIKNIMDGLYYSPEVGEHYKSNLQKKLEAERDSTKREDLEFFLSQADKLIEKDKKVKKEGAEVESETNGWYSIRKATELISQPLGEGVVISSRYAADIVKGLQQSYLELRKQGARGHLTFETILDGIDPGEEVVRQSTGDSAVDILKAWLDKRLEEYVTREEVKRELKKYPTREEQDGAIKTAIDEIPKVDLSGYARKTDVDGLCGRVDKIEKDVVGKADRAYAGSLELGASKTGEAGSKPVEVHIDPIAVTVNLERKHGDSGIPGEHEHEGYERKGHIHSKYAQRIGDLGKKVADLGNSVVGKADKSDVDRKVDEVTARINTIISGISEETARKIVKEAIGELGEVYAPKEHSHPDAHPGIEARIKALEAVKSAPQEHNHDSKYASVDEVRRISELYLGIMRELVAAIGRSATPVNPPIDYDKLGRALGEALRGAINIENNATMGNIENVGNPKVTLPPQAAPTVASIEGYDDRELRGKVSELDGTIRRLCDEITSLNAAYRSAASRPVEPTPIIAPQPSSYEGLCRVIERLIETGERVARAYGERNAQPAQQQQPIIITPPQAAAYDDKGIRATLTDLSEDVRRLSEAYQRAEDARRTPLVTTPSGPAADPNEGLYRILQSGVDTIRNGIEGLKDIAQAYIAQNPRNNQAPEAPQPETPASQGPHLAPPISEERGEEAPQESEQPTESPPPAAPAAPAAPTDGGQEGAGNNNNGGNGDQNNTPPAEHHQPAAAGHEAAHNNDHGTPHQHAGHEANHHTSPMDAYWKTRTGVENEIYRMEIDMMEAYVRTAKDTLKVEGDPRQLDLSKLKQPGERAKYTSKMNEHLVNFAKEVMGVSEVRDRNHAESLMYGIYGINQAIVGQIVDTYTSDLRYEHLWKGCEERVKAKRMLPLMDINESDTEQILEAAGLESEHETLEKTVLANVISIHKTEGRVYQKHIDALNQRYMARLRYKGQEGHQHPTPVAHQEHQEPAQEHHAAA